jgi:hypothetical protein
MTDNVLDTISQEIVSDARNETFQPIQDESPEFYNYKGIQHMLVIYMHNWNRTTPYERDFIRGTLRRYITCIMPVICNRYNIIIKEPGQKIIDSEDKEEILDTYLMMVPLRCSTTPYSFFIAVQQVMQVLHFADIRFHLDMYMRDPGGEFVDYGSYSKDGKTNKPPTMNGIKELLRTGTQSDVMESIKNAKSYELFRKMDTWGLFSAMGYNADDIEMGFMRVLLRE